MRFSIRDQFMQWLRNGELLSGQNATMRKVRIGVLLFLCGVAGAQAQEAAHAPLSSANPPSAPALSRRPTENAPDASATVALTVPKGTPVEVALDQEVRVRKAGESIGGHVVEPVYAFDKLVIPAGTRVTGEITRIESVSGGKRAMAALDADFSPSHKIQVAFSEFVTADGKRIAVRTSVMPGSGQVVQFVSAAAANSEKKGMKDEAEKKTEEARRRAKQAWADAMKQVKAPGKIHRIERFAIAELPVHPQYIDAGTVYFAELEEPLDFGSEPLTREMAASIGTAPPDGAAVNARLVTPLSSAIANKGDEVEAVVTQPLFDGDRLILPQGSLMKGSVVQVQPARRMSRNGQLRFVFHDLVLPDGVEQKVDAILQGVQAGKADDVKLDAEGGAQASTPKTRYLQTAISVGLAAASLGGDADSKVANPAGNTSNRVAGGAGGFKLVGMALGVAVKSRAFGYSMGGYGAGMSIYTHFVARGRDVVFAKNTAMEIGIATRKPGAAGEQATRN